MFITLLAVTFLIACLVSFISTRIFNTSIYKILKRIVEEDISHVWARYLSFAIYVVGISGGVRVWDLEKYITPRPEEADAIILNADRWVLEVYRTIIGTFQSIAWMLLIFFIFALIAYVIVTGREAKKIPQA